jgi:hypothetical protein
MLLCHEIAAMPRVASISLIMNSARTLLACSLQTTPLGLHCQGPCKRQTCETTHPAVPSTASTTAIRNGSAGTLVFWLAPTKPWST